jgi:hypothetical protein
LDKKCFEKISGILLQCVGTIQSQDFIKLISACAVNVDAPNYCLEYLMSLFSTKVKLKFLPEYFVKMSYSLTLELIEEAKAFRDIGSGTMPLLNVQLEYKDEGIQPLYFCLTANRSRPDFLFCKSV